MKKIVIVILSILLLTGCGTNSNKDTNNTTNYSGKETTLSKKYLSNGYLVNIYRSSQSLGDDEENYGKSYITMTFNVITDFTSTVGYDETNYHIKKKRISNIRIIKSPNMGMVESIYPNYAAFNSTNEEIKGSKNYYEEEFSTPIYFSGQTSIGVDVNRIALFDAANYGWNEQPTTSEIYNDLGITREEVSLILGFRVELITVEGKTLYKDYEIEMPPVGYDIAGLEFQMNFMTDDISLMETFLEKQ